MVPAVEVLANVMGTLRQVANAPITGSPGCVQATPQKMILASCVKAQLVVGGLAAAGDAAVIGRATAVTIADMALSSLPRMRNSPPVR